MEEQFNSNLVRYDFRDLPYFLHKNQIQIDEGFKCKVFEEGSRVVYTFFAVKSSDCVQPRSKAKSSNFFFWNFYTAKNSINKSAEGSSFPTHHLNKQLCMYLFYILVLHVRFHLTECSIARIRREKEEVEKHSLLMYTEAHGS